MMEFVYIIAGFILFCVIVSRFSKKTDEYDAFENNKRGLKGIGRLNKNSCDIEEYNRKGKEEEKPENTDQIKINNQEVSPKVDNQIYETEYGKPLGKQLPLWLPDFIITEVKGTFYRDDSEKEAAKLLEVGDELELWEEPDNPHDRNAVAVVTKEDWICIGYVDAGDSPFVSKNLKYIDKVIAIKKSNHNIPYIKIKILFKWDVENMTKNRDIIKYDMSKGSDYVDFNLISISSFNGEIIWALNHWKENPKDALFIFKKYSKNERGIAFKHECCKCLRKLKEYEKEIEVINEILERIRFPQNPCVSRLEHEVLLGCRDNYEKRLCVANRLLDNKNKKNRKS